MRAIKVFHEIKIYLIVDTCSEVWCVDELRISYMDMQIVCSSVVPTQFSYETNQKTKM